MILSPGLRVVGQVWDQIGTSEKIQDEESVGANFIPQAHWVRRITAAENGNEVVFEGSTGLLGRVAWVVMGEN